MLRTLLGWLVVLTCGPMAAAETPVIPLALPQGKADVQDVERRVYDAIQKQAHYMLGLVRPWKDDPALLLVTESRSGENWIRPNTGTVAGLCFLHRFGPYDEKRVGVSRKDLLEKSILPMLRYLLTTHVTGTRPTSDGRPWGDAWQSAHWAQMLGRGAWWTWADLPTDVRDGVRRLVAHEADRIAGSEPPHQIPLDTKAEENAWNSRVLEAAVLLLPDDRRRPGWEAAFQQWVLSAFLRPADAHCQTVVDGRTVAEQFRGANIHDDFTLENHRIVHPDYMTCFSLSLGAAVNYAMSGRRAPQCLSYNAAGIYENLKWFVLPDGGFVYPNGQDWQLFRNADWFGAHVQMVVFGNDRDAWSLAGRSLAALEKMQGRGLSGAVYAPDETAFASSQSDLLSSLSTAWLAIKTAQRIDSAPCDRLGVQRLDSAKIILRRTASAIHTFSWGAQVMAQCVPYRLDRVVSPHSKNGVGRIVAQGQKGPLPARLERADVTQGADWFTAQVVLDHGGQIRAELCFRSLAGGAWSVREKLTATADVTTAEIATGLIGILNNPGWVYESGRRQVRLDGREEIVPALSGKTLGGDEVCEVDIDSALRIRSPRPLHVRYAGAKRPDRSRATDELYLNYLGGKRLWRAGQVISEYEATIEK